MGAPKENQFWKARSSHGRSKIFESPDVLWQAACEYFEWVEENPWHKYDPVKAGPNFGESVLTPVGRPMTLTGLCLFLDISKDTFDNYCSNKEDYKDYFVIANKIKDIIRNQKFEGAAVGVFNANIIARDLGLIDKTEHDVKGDVNVNPKKWVK